MKTCVRFAGFALAVAVISTVAFLYGAKCWDAVIIRLIDDRISGHSQDTYNMAITKIRSVDPLIGYIRSKKRKNAELMRNEGRRYLAEFDADHRDESFLACIRIRYFALCDLQFDNVLCHEIAECLKSFKDEGAYYLGCQMQLDDIKRLHQQGQIDQSKLDQASKRLEVLENEMRKGEQGNAPP